MCNDVEVEVVDTVVMCTVPASFSRSFLCLAFVVVVVVCCCLFVCMFALVFMVQRSTHTDNDYEF